MAGAREAFAEAHRIADSSTVVGYAALREDLLWLVDDAEQPRVLTLTPADLDGGRADWAIALAQTWYRRGDRARARAYADTAHKAYDLLIPHALHVGDSTQFGGLQALALAYTGAIPAAVKKGEAALSAARAGLPWQQRLRPVSPDAHPRARRPARRGPRAARSRSPGRRRAECPPASSGSTTISRRSAGTRGLTDSQAARDR